jgi:PadR family transcriptional regulator, regulatory protein PadR
MTSDSATLGEFEQLVLLAVLCAAQAADAYGVNIHAELEHRARRRVALDRLEKKGLLSSYQTDPTPERGGRAKRCYVVTKPALAALRASRRALLSLWQGLERLEP